jgi:transposase
MNDAPMAELLLNDLPAGAEVLADKGYDADWIRDLIEDQGCTPHIPPRSNRYDGITYSKTKYKKRNLIERCFNKLKQFRHIATRYDRSALNYLAMIKIACVRLWLRFRSLALLWQIYPRHCFHGFVFGSVGIAEIVVEE